jgi:hypothetical protein
VTCTNAFFEELFVLFRMPYRIAPVASSGSCVISKTLQLVLKKWETLTERDDAAVAIAVSSKTAHLPVIGPRYNNGRQCYPRQRRFSGFSSPRLWLDARRQKGVVAKRLNEIGDRPSLYRRVSDRVVNWKRQ